MDSGQLMRGVLEQCVLALIEQGETYGYDILSKLSQAGFDQVMEGTLYPVLTRLNKKKLVSCRMVKSPYGPMRKLYSITNTGLEELRQFREVYKGFSASAAQILFMEDKR